MFCNRLFLIFNDRLAFLDGCLELGYEPLYFGNIQRTTTDIHLQMVRTVDGR
jgi:hypothetical protein